MTAGYDVAVVGKGLIGSAAARHLSGAGLRTALIGPDEPADPASHNGLFGSHYDEGRLTHRSARNLTWALLAARAMAAYAEIEARSGIAFHQVRGTLTLERDHGAFSYTVQRQAISAALGFRYQELPTPDAVQRAFPLVACPPAFHGLLDPAPSGFINPRAMLRAETTIAAAQGTDVLRAAVTALQPAADSVRLTLDSGAELTARQVILATGAHLHSFGLLPNLPQVTVKSEVVTLGEVDAATAAAWAAMPSMLYDIVDDEIDEIYLVPPVRYPDGRWYLKLGSNAVTDRLLPDHAAIVDWMRCGDATTISAAQARAMQALFPTTHFLRFQAARCMITRTAHGLPFIDRLHERVVIAAGGNGAAAKSADAVGELAACLVRNVAWPAPFRPADFRLREVRPHGT